jgi:hypothetical protein
MMARLMGLKRRYQDGKIKLPVDPTGKSDMVPDEDVLERTDFFACLLRNWTPKN